MLYGLDASLVPQLVAEANALAWSENLNQSPWGWCAHGLLLLAAGDAAAALEADQAAVAAAEKRGDEVTAAIAAAQVLTAKGALGQLDGSNQEVAAVLERARRSGHPASIATAVICSASLPLYHHEPDFDACLAVIDASSLPSDRMLETWWHVLRGFALLGLQRAGAEEELFTAVRLAERTGNVTALIHSLLLLALAWTGRGELADAAVLQGYVAAYRSHIHRNAGYAWVERSLHRVLAGLEQAELARLEETGRSMSRREISSFLKRATFVA